MPPIDPTPAQPAEPPRVLVIDLDERWADCWRCGELTPSRWGLPVWNGELVSNDWQGEWGGVPACEACFDLHAAGKLSTLDCPLKEEPVLDYAI
jgi:hypothetical protein